MAANTTTKKHPKPTGNVQDFAEAAECLKTLPLIQQVQITPEFWTVLGVVPAHLVHACFAGLSALVGAGLMFAGVIGLCPVASTIAEMPWNQFTGGGSCSA